MYSRKIVRPRMDPRGTLALSGYSCEDFPSRTTQNRLLLRKRKRKPNIRPVKRTSMSNPVKSLGYIKCHSLSSPRTVKPLAILSDTTVRRSAVDREDLKPYWKSEKKATFL